MMVAMFLENEKEKKTKTDFVQRLVAAKNRYQKLYI